MEPMSFTAGGGEVKDLTAAPGSSLACDSCGATGELTEWESSDAKMYHYCNVCWVDIRDSADELANLTCREEDGRCGCDDCGSPTELTSEFWHADGRTLHLCERCYQSADDSEDYLEPLPKRQEVQCEDCAERPASETFHHLDGRCFKLCGDCFGMADHEEDYGASFGSVPRLRVSAEAKLCDCPLPCDFVDPTRCELCKGLVVCLRDA